MLNGLEGMIEVGEEWDVDFDEIMFMFFLWSMCVML